MNKQKLIELITENEAELIELCSDLLKIPSENPLGDTTAISEFIENYLSKNGIESVKYEPDAKRYDLVAKIGSEHGKKLVYCGHSDTVPVGDQSQWTFDPFSGAVREGLLLGRGASDMKGGLAGIIFTLAILKRYEIQLDGELTLAVVPDEESGGEFGVPWLLNEGLIKGDGCLIAEPSSPLNPTIGQKGACWFRLTVFGVPGHGSLAPFVGENAIVDAIAAIERIRTVTSLKIETPEDVKELLSVSNQYLLEKEPRETKGVFEKITCNIGTIHGGTSSNVVADKCVVEIDCRLPFGITNAETMDYITAELDKLHIQYSIESFGFKSSANFTAAEDPICQAIVENIKYVAQEEAYGVLQWACSDARHFREHQIPVLQYGPAELATIHGFDEKVKVADLVQCAKVYLLAAVDFLNEA